MIPKTIVNIIKALLFAGVAILLYVLGGFVFFLFKLAVVGLVVYYVVRKKDKIVSALQRWKKILDTTIDNS